MNETKNQDPMREAFEQNRNVGRCFLQSGGSVESLSRTRARLAGILAGVVESIEEELTNLNARKVLLEEELYKYTAAAELMLKQMTNEQN